MFNNNYITNMFSSSSASFNRAAREEEVKKDLESISGILQTIYFETYDHAKKQGWARSNETLDNTTPDRAFLTLYNGFQEFVKKDLSPKKREKYKAEIDGVLKELEVAKPYFLKASLLMLEKDPTKKVHLAKELGKDLFEYVKAIPKGESRLIPGGYFNGNAYSLDPEMFGHAFLIEITHKKNGLYDFKIFNTGEGVENHKSFFTRSGTQLFNNYILEDIHPAFLGPSFFQELTLLSMGMGHDGQPIKKAIYSKDIYDFVETMTFRSDSPKRRKKYQPQMIRGNCTYKSLSVWLHGKLPPAIHQEFKYKKTKKDLKKLEAFIGAEKKRLGKNFENSSTPYVHPIARIGYAENTRFHPLITYSISLIKGERISADMPNKEIEELHETATQVLKNRREKFSKIDKPVKVVGSKKSKRRQ